MLLLFYKSPSLRYLLFFTIPKPKIATVNKAPTIIPIIPSVTYGFGSDMKTNAAENPMKIIDDSAAKEKKNITILALFIFIFPLNNLYKKDV